MKLYAQAELHSIEQLKKVSSKLITLTKQLVEFNDF